MMRERTTLSLSGDWRAVARRLLRVPYEGQGAVRGEEEEALEKFLVTETKAYADYAKSRRGGGERAEVVEGAGPRFREGHAD